MSSIKVSSGVKTQFSDFVNVHIQQTTDDITEVLDEDNEDTQLDLQVINQNGTISLNTPGVAILNSGGDQSTIINKGSFVKQTGSFIAN
jgi:frataxin-like iron-binding protein CyaY